MDGHAENVDWEMGMADDPLEEATNLESTYVSHNLYVYKSNVSVADSTLKAMTLDMPMVACTVFLKVAN